MSPVIFILALIPSTICLSLAGYLAVNNVGGWGWFLFVGLMLGGFSFTTKGEK